MNRKIATIIILVVFVTALVVISIIGTVGLDWSQNIIVTEIYITDKDGVRLEKDEDLGMVTIEIELPELENTYTFNYVIVPDKADLKDVEFVLENTYKDRISIVGSGGSAIITFIDGSVPEEGFVVTIRALDGSEETCSIAFTKKQVDSGETDI